jgi:hypothetical protein
VNAAYPPELLTEDDPLVEVRVGPRAIVQVHQAVSDDRRPGPREARWAVIAVDLDGMYLSTLATVRDVDQVPAPVLAAALATAHALYGDNAPGAPTGGIGW